MFKKETSLIFSCFLFTLVLVFLFLTESKRISLFEIKFKADELERGAALYTLHCKNCHGIRGEGVGQLGPSLSDELFFTKRTSEVAWTSTLEDYVRNTTEAGRLMGTRPIYAGNGSTAVMPPWHQRAGGPLRSDEIEAITAFVLNWEETALGKVHFEKLNITHQASQNSEFIKRGQKVFIQHCNSCHNYKNQDYTRYPGPDLTEIRSLASTRKPERSPEEYIEESILIPEIFHPPGFDKAAGQETCGTNLTISELKAVTTFLLQ